MFTQQSANSRRFRERNAEKPVHVPVGYPNERRSVHLDLGTPNGSHFWLLGAADPKLRNAEEVYPGSCGKDPQGDQRSADCKLA